MHSVPRTESIHSMGPSSESDDTSDALVESRLQYALRFKGLEFTEVTTHPLPSYDGLYRYPL